jgi:hypothetical protein
MGTFGALLEIPFGFLDCVAECLVVARTPHCPFDFVAARTRPPENAAKQIAGDPQPARHETGHGRLELAHEAVAAAIAEKLELVALIG